MKLLREIIRQYIRQVLFEIRDLSPEEITHARELEKSIAFPGKILPYEDGKDVRRAAGLQPREEQQKDRTFLQVYQADVRKSDSGRKMQKAFINGSITIMHSIGYRGLTYRYGLGGSDQDLYEVSDWVKKFGTSGKDTLSTVAFPTSLSQSLPNKLISVDNIDAVSSSRGILLKGFPVYVSDRDVMSQTLGAMSPALKKHQAQSGIAKRASSNPDDVGPIYSLEQMAELGGAQEALLDNWNVISTYINYPPKQGRGALKETKSFVKDSLSLNLPCNIYWQGELIARIKNEKDYNAWLSSEKEGKYYV